MSSEDFIEVAPGCFRLRRPAMAPVARSALPAPHVISDEMEPTEQVDGVFYSSKAKFRAVGRALGLTEVGTERPKLKTTRSSTSAEVKRSRRQAFEKVAAQYRAGRRARME